jgi:hypothetical protein
MTALNLALGDSGVRLSDVGNAVDYLREQTKNESSYEARVTLDVG